MAESLNTALRSRARLVGTVLTLPGAASAELFADPLDVVWIDLEHGALGATEAQDMLIGAQAAGAFVLARLPAQETALMTVMLDAGVDGVVLADVRNARTVTQAITRTTHPPGGSRGWGPRRLALHRRREQRAALTPSLWVQIESAAGVDQAGAIAAVTGVDAVVVGTADLSLALGVPLDLHAPRLGDAVSEVARGADRAGVVFGVAGPLDQAPADLCRDASILIHSTDARLCATSVDAAATWLRNPTDHSKETSFT